MGGSRFFRQWPASVMPADSQCAQAAERRDSSADSHSHLEVSQRCAPQTPRMPAATPSALPPAMASAARPQALAMAGAALDYLNSAAVAGLDGAGLRRNADRPRRDPGQAHRRARRFPAPLRRRRRPRRGRVRLVVIVAGREGGHVEEGRRAAVRQMRQLGDRPLLGDALAAGDITDSLAFTIAGLDPQAARADARRDRPHPAARPPRRARPWTTWPPSPPARSRPGAPSSPTPTSPDPDDRYLQLGTTFGDAGVIRGDLTPECATAVRAVLEALGKKAGPEDDRTEGQRFHDALQLACTLLLRARLVPARAGADTQAVIHIPLSQLRQLPGAQELEDAWIRARAGEDGYLTGTDARDRRVRRADRPGRHRHHGPRRHRPDDRPGPDRRRGRRATARRAAGAGTGAAARHRCTPGPARCPPRPGAPCATRWPASPSTWSPARPASPRSCARACSTSRTTPRPSRSTSATATPSRPTSAAPSCCGTATCAWPRCGRPAVYCDVHHLRHKQDGGETSVENCALVCQFHHDVCIHRRGWQLTLHPDGTTEARSPDGRQVLRSHAPPSPHAA